MSYQDKAARVAFPFGAADTTGSRGIMAIAVTTTSSSTQLPRAMGGKFLHVQAVDNSVQLNITIGTAGQTLTAGATSVPGTGNAARGYTVLAGTSREGLIPTPAAGQNIYLNAICATGTATLEVFCSEQVIP